MGLEHPWDKDDGDFAVNNWSDPHASTRMGYNEHLSGKVGWYEDIDISALQNIWGEAEVKSYSGNSYDYKFYNLGNSKYAPGTVTSFCIAMIWFFLPDVFLIRSLILIFHKNHHYYHQPLLLPPNFYIFDF